MNTKQTVNYPKHLEAFSTYWQEINFTLSANERFSPILLALYYHLFHQWNQARFPKFLDIHRENTMQSCGIGNHLTYTNALRALETKGLLSYFPSQSRYKSSQVELVILTEANLKTLISSLCKSEPSNVQTPALSSEQTTEHADKQTRAALYQTTQTEKTNKQRKEGNSDFSPPIFFENEFSLLDSEKEILIEKVIQWCNYVRMTFLSLPELLKTSKEKALQSQAAIELYQNLHSPQLDFAENMKVVNQRFTLYAQFLKSKPNDTFLREMFTPQGITAKNVFQQFEQGASDIQTAQTQTISFPDKWNEKFYSELQLNKQATAIKQYEQKLKEELGLEVYLNGKTKRWGVRKK